MRLALRAVRWQRRLALAAVALVVALLLIQFVPYGHAHSNPRVQAEPRWNSTQTRALVTRACYDCHSNQTTWPWYSSIAPVSWLIQNDVDAGRARLNFTQWTQPQRSAGRAAEVVRSGRMPPWYFLVLHPRAQLSSSEKQALIQGLIATFGDSPRRREAAE